MKKIWAFITTFLLSFSLIIPCYAQEVDDLGFTSVEEYDYYREKIPDYVETFSKEFAEWYVNNPLPDKPEQTDYQSYGDVDCNCGDYLQDYLDDSENEDTSYNYNNDEEVSYNENIVHNDFDDIKVESKKDIPSFVKVVLEISDKITFILDK